MVHRTSFSRHYMPFFVATVYLFLYVPIVILIIFSFNNAAFPYVWKGFTLNWYHELWHSTEVWDAVYNSFCIAILTVFFSLVMGVALVLYAAHSVMVRSLVLFYGTLAAPEIVLAVGLLSFFSLCSVPLGFTTLVAAHTLLGLGYVVPILYDSYSELDYSVVEASMDLGATKFQTYWWVVLPMLRPAVVAAALLVFIISLDDFMISFFCSGASTQTLPMYIFSMIRSGTTPIVNAVSTVLLLVSSLLVLLFSSLNVKRTEMLS